MAELALPYVPIDPGIESSDKMDLFIELVGAEDDPMAPMKVVKFLLWAGRHRPDGNLGKLTPRRLAVEMCWEGDPAKLMAAMVESEWLRRHEDGTTSVVNWDKHGGRVITERNRFREQAAERKRRQRERENQASSAGVTDQLSDVTPCHGDVTRDIVTVTPSHALEGEGEPEGEVKTTTPVAVVPLGTERVPWSTGAISSRAECLDAWAAWGWCLGPEVPDKARGAAKRVTDAGPISAEEWAEAKEIAEREKPRARDRPSYFLGVVERRRRDALDAERKTSPPPMSMREVPSWKPLMVEE